MDFVDQTLVCSDCGQEFIHTVDDQQRYAEKGFTHLPKRCRTCREKRRNEKALAEESGPQPGNEAAPRSAIVGGDRPPRRDFGDRPPRRDFGDRPPRRDFGDRPQRGRFGPPGGGRGGGGGGMGGPRELHNAVCSACGKQTQVPFKPRPGKPVYCRDCYRNLKGQGA